MCVVYRTQALIESERRELTERIKRQRERAKGELEGDSEEERNCQQREREKERERERAGERKCKSVLL